MNCKDIKRNISSWLDGELNDDLKVGLVEEHLKGCASCKKEVESFRLFQKTILEAVPTKIEPSPNFEARFWTKVDERERTPRVVRVFEWIPMPSFAQAAAALLVAVLIGGAGGAVSAMNAPEIKGISSSSVASNYLKLIESENLK